jgi:hypothetical protein
LQISLARRWITRPPVLSRLILLTCRAGELPEEMNHFVAFRRPLAPYRQILLSLMAFGLQIASSCFIHRRRIATRSHIDGQLASDSGRPQHRSALICSFRRLTGNVRQTWLLGEGMNVSLRLCCPKAFAEWVPHVRFVAVLDLFHESSQPYADGIGPITRLSASKNPFLFQHLQ